MDYHVCRDTYVLFSVTYVPTEWNLVLVDPWGAMPRERREGDESAGYRGEWSIGTLSDWPCGSGTTLS